MAKTDSYQELLKQIGKLDLETLRRLNRDVCEAIKDRRRMNAHAAALKFKIGDRARSVSRTGRVVAGVIQKINITRARILDDADGRLWDVPLDMLELVKEGGRA
jgi:hypothetical protein